MLMACLIAGGAARASAQIKTDEPRGFLELGAGAQPRQQEIATSASFPLFDETATVTTRQIVHNGPVYGLGAGYRFGGSFGAGASITFFKARTGDSGINASIPSAAFFNRPQVVNTTIDGLNHQQFGLHLQAIWFRRLTDRFEATLAAGPSFINVKHDLATASVSGTQFITGKVTEQKTGIGVNAGGTLVYDLTPRVGIGVFVRYAGGKIDLPSVKDLAVGGVQGGLGLRIPF